MFYLYYYEAHVEEQIKPILKANALNSHEVIEGTEEKKTLSHHEAHEEHGEHGEHGDKP